MNAVVKETGPSVSAALEPGGDSVAESFAVGATDRRFSYWDGGSELDA
jgi:hypothetical protein